MALTKFIFPMRPPPPWKPTNIGSCIIWLRSDYAWQDAAKAVPCTDGTLIYTGEDRSASLKDFVQAVDDNKPTYVENDTNGNPIWLFTNAVGLGVGTFLAATSAIPIGLDETALTAIAWVKLLGYAANSWTPVWGNGGSSNIFMGGAPDGRMASVHWPLNTGVYPADDFTLNTFHMLTYTIERTGGVNYFELYNKLDLKGSDSNANVAGSAVLNTLLYGYTMAGVWESTSAKFGEGAIYNRKLSFAEITNFYNNTKSRWE